VGQPAPVGATHPSDVTPHTDDATISQAGVQLTDPRGLSAANGVVQGTQGLGEVVVAGDAEALDPDVLGGAMIFL